MEYHEKELFVQALIDRTKQGELNWSIIKNHIICETVGVKFVLYKNSEYEVLEVLDKNITLFEFKSNYSSLVCSLYNVAKQRAQKLGEKRLMEVVDMINKKIKPIVVDSLEVNREI